MTTSTLARKRRHDPSIEARANLANDVSSAVDRHRDDIQGLRGIAVLLVALGHAGVSFLGGGFIGVDVFFVLSGFLITGLLLSGAAKRGFVSVSDFYVRRARRILPAATLTLVVTDMVANHMLNFVRAKQIMYDSVWASVFGANFHFASQGTDYFARAQPASPIQHFWSLAVEEQFYLAWPLLLSLVVFGPAVRYRIQARRRGSRGPRARVITERAVRRVLLVVMAAAAASLCWSVFDTSTHAASAYFSTFARAWELALGAGLAIGTSRLARLPSGVRAVAGWTGLVCIAAAAVMYSSATAFPGYAALLPTVGAALVIAAGIGNHRTRFGIGRLLATRPLCYVGDRSYTFYLWHWPVLTIAILYVGHRLSLGMNLLLLAGAFVLSIVTYRFFENPLRRLTWKPPRAALVMWPASVMIGFLVAHSIIYSIDVNATRLDSAPAAKKAALAQTTTTAPTTSVQPVAAASRAGGALPAVVSAANAAARGAQIPSALTPSPDNLINDHYDVPQGCIAPDGASTSNICRLGSGSSNKSLVVMGDSHAEMWLPAVLGMAQRANWQVIPLVKSACTPATWWNESPGAADCHAWYGWATSQIASLHPAAVLITGNFVSLGSSDANHNATVSSLGSLSAKVKRASKDVVVLGDSPSLTQQPVDCLLASGATMGRCSTTPTAAQLSIYDDLALGAEVGGAHFLDPTNWFCYQNTCPMVIGNTIAYFDTNHITKTYSQELAPAFTAAFAQLVTHSATKTANTRTDSARSRPASRRG